MAWGDIAIGFALAIAFIIVLQLFKSRPKVPLPPKGQGTMADVQRLLSEGHKIAAIKVYREVHGVGLKEAKEAVEAMQR